MAYKKSSVYSTSILGNETVEGKTIEQKVEGMINNKEPLTDGAPIIHQERKDGVRQEYNIRTDRFELAIDGHDAITKTELAKRDARHNPKTDDHKDGGKDGAEGKSDGTSANSATSKD